VGKDDTISLDLKEDTLPGKTGMFSGNIPPIMSPGSYVMRGNLLVGERSTSIRFVETLTVKESKNSAEKLQLPKKVTKVNSGEVFVYGVQYINTGNDEWTKHNMKLELVHRNTKKAFLLQEDRVLPGEKGNFIIEIDTKEKLQPYILVLRDGIQKLRSDVFFLLGTQGVSSASPVTKSDNPVLKYGVIRIKLSYPNGRSSVQITSAGSFSLANAQGKVLKTFSADDKLSLSKKGELIGFDKSYSTAMRLTSKTNTAFEISSWERYPAWDTTKQWNDNLFLGSLEIRVEDGELIVVNELPLETYLLGIAEVPESEHSEKKKAIAVSARSYALHYLDEQNRKFPGKPYDGSDDPAIFQKYLGANYIRRAPGWRLSVLSTTGEVVKFNNEVIKTPFHSCSGGKTLSAEEVWGWEDIPYLISLPDPGGVGKNKSGHGVGLSGCGAQYFAEEGKDYKEILKYYYPGTVVGK
jgi:peptidoglycan hydrolase-like amidase